MSSENCLEIARHEELIEKAIIEGNEPATPVSRRFCFSDKEDAIAGLRCYVVVR